MPTFEVTHTVAEQWEIIRPTTPSTAHNHHLHDNSTVQRAPRDCTALPTPPVRSATRIKRTRRYCSDSKISTFSNHAILKKLLRTTNVLSPLLRPPPCHKTHRRLGRSSAGDAYRIRSQEANEPKRNTGGEATRQFFFEWAKQNGVLCSIYRGIYETS